MSNRAAAPDIREHYRSLWPHFPDIAEMLKEWRQRMGYRSYRVAADELGVTAQTYAKWEKGSPIDVRTALACLELERRAAMTKLPSADEWSVQRSILTYLSQRMPKDVVAAAMGATKPGNGE